MEFAEIRERYKSKPLKVRAAASAGVGTLVVIFAYFSSFDFNQLEEQEVAASASAQDAQTKFESARDQKANLPKLEEAVAVTEEQLVKAKAKLPANYDVEDTLHKVSTIAKEINVQFTSFQPQAEIISTGNNRYAELPINVSLCGSYVQIAAFFDRVVHLEQSVKIRDIKMVSSGPCSTGPKDPESNLPLVGLEGAREQRRRLKIDTTAQLVLFRASQSAGGLPQSDPNGGTQPAGGATPAAPAAPPPDAESGKTVESANVEKILPKIVRRPVVSPTKSIGGNG